MSHDKIKAAARRRMSATGEPYSAARRQVISEHNADRFTTSAVSAEDIHAAAEIHRELGPEYSDAVVASFLDKVDRAVAARVEARLAEQERSARAKLGSWVQRSLSQRVVRYGLAASAGALVALGAVGVHGFSGSQAGPPANVSAKAASTGGPGTKLWCRTDNGPWVTVTKGSTVPLVPGQARRSSYLCVIPPNSGPG